MAKCKSTCWRFVTVRTVIQVSGDGLMDAQKFVGTDHAAYVGVEYAACDGTLQGSCAVWYNLMLSGEGDYDTRHAACPVLSGSKWSMLHCLFVILCFKYNLCEVER